MVSLSPGHDGRSFLHNGRFAFPLLAVFLTFALVLAGCGGANGQNANQSGSESAAGADGSGGGSGGAGTGGKEVRVIQHAMGQTEVPAHPQRVVILTNEGTEALLALGVKPVGAVKSWTGDPWYDHIKDMMEGVKVVGTESEVNVEAVAALKPDLILGNKMRQEKIYSQLNAIAPTVFSDTLRGEWQTNFKLYAEALNKRAEGEKILSDFNKRIEELRAKLGDKIHTKVSIVRFMAGKTRLYQKDSFSGVILKQIGIARPPSQDKDGFAEEITKERIPEADGDILFYFTYETGNGEGSKQEQEWVNDPLFQNLNAVKNGKAYKVDDAIWNTAGGVLAANLFLDDLEKYLLQN